MRKMFCGGKTWEGGLVLDERKSVTYPDVKQEPDGLISVTHDFGRSREAEIILHTFTEEDILAKRFQSRSPARALSS